MRTAVHSVTRPLTPALAADPALDDALDRIALLSARLHAVTDLHVARRRLLGGAVCRACSRPAPCPTARATTA